MTPQECKTHAPTSSRKQKSITKIQSWLKQCFCIIFGWGIFQSFFKGPIQIGLQICFCQCETFTICKKKSKVTFNETMNSRLGYNIGASYRQPLPSSQRTLHSTWFCVPLFWAAHGKFEFPHPLFQRDKLVVYRTQYAPHYNLQVVYLKPIFWKPKKFI